MNEIDAQIIKLYAEGHSIRKVIGDVNRSYGYVYKVLDKNGIPRRTKGYGNFREIMDRLTLEELVEIVEYRINTKAPIQQVTYKFNLINDGVTRNILNRADYYLETYYNGKGVDTSLDNVVYD